MTKNVEFATFTQPEVHQIWSKASSGINILYLLTGPMKVTEQNFIYGNVQFCKRVSDRVRVYTARITSVIAAATGKYRDGQARPYLRRLSSAIVVSFKWLPIRFAQSVERRVRCVDIRSRSVLPPAASDRPYNCSFLRCPFLSVCSPLCSIFNLFLVLTVTTLLLLLHQFLGSLA